MMTKYLLEIIVFTSGATVMVLELIGSRILAPYYGTSVIVWTDLLGVVLLSLSIGYWLGGFASDKKANSVYLSVLLLLSGILIGLTAISKEIILSFLSQFIQPFIISSLVSTVTLLALPNVMLGMILPYCTKLKLTKLRTSGTTVGKLYALSTVGSIVGIFLAGYYLIPTFGNTNILFILSCMLIILSMIVSTASFKKWKLFSLLSILLFVYLSMYKTQLAREHGFLDVDSMYNRIWVLDAHDDYMNRPIRLLMSGAVRQAGIYLDNPAELAFRYLKFFRLANYFNPHINRALAIGGGGYTFMQNYLSSNPSTIFDVVEIDPKITELAQKYFDLSQSLRLNIYHEDARTFINRSKTDYDAIFIDVFNGYTVPYQLISREATEKIYNLLKPNGIVLINIVSAIEGNQGKLLRAVYHTYNSVFPQTFIFPIDHPDKETEIKNIILIASKSNKKFDMVSSNKELNSYLKNLWRKNIEKNVPVLTDDYALVEYYLLNFNSEIDFIRTFYPSGLML